MTLQEMVLLVKQHWKTTNPRIYQAMVDRKELERMALASARLMHGEMEIQMAAGATEAEGWEASREIFFITDPAKDYQLEDAAAQVAALSPEEKKEPTLVDFLLPTGVSDAEHGIGL